MKKVLPIALVIILSVFIGLIILKINDSGLKWIIYFAGLLSSVLFITLFPEKKKLLLIVYFITIPLNIVKHFGDFSITPIGAVFKTGWESLLYFSINEILLYILFLIFISKIIVTGKKIVLYKADLAYILYFLVIIISILLNYSISNYGLKYVRSAFVLLVIYLYISRNFDGSKHLNIFLYTMMGILLFECLVSFGQLVGKTFSILTIFGSNDGSGTDTAFYTSNIKRVWGTFSHSNPFASFLVIIMPLVLSGGFILKEKIHRIMFFSVYGLGLIVLFFTYSRGAWFSTIIQIMIFMWFGRKVLPKWVYNKGLWLALLIIFSIMLSFKIEDLIFRLASDESKNAGLTRLTQSKVAFYYFSHNPFLGIGAGNYINQLPSIDRMLNVFSAGLPVHNIYFLSLAQIGIIGLILYLAQYLISIKRLFISMAKNKPELKIFSLCILMSFCGHMFHNLVDLAEVQYDISSMVYLLFGISASLFINLQKENNN